MVSAGLSCISAVEKTAGPSSAIEVASCTQWVAARIYYVSDVARIGCACGRRNTKAPARCCDEAWIEFGGRCWSRLSARCGPTPWRPLKMVWGGCHDCSRGAQHCAFTKTAADCTEESKPR